MPRKKVKLAAVVGRGRVGRPKKKQDVAARKEATRQEAAKQEAEKREAEKREAAKQKADQQESDSNTKPKRRGRPPKLKEGSAADKSIDTVDSDQVKKLRKRLPKAAVKKAEKPEKAEKAEKTEKTPEPAVQKEKQRAVPGQVKVCTAISVHQTNPPISSEVRIPEVHKRKRRIGSPLRAIQLKCKDCCGGVLEEVEKCPIDTCPLYIFRMGDEDGISSKK